MTRPAPLRLAGVAILLVIGLLVAAVGLLRGGVVHAQSGDERILAYDVDVAIQRDGSLRIVERIEYDFGSNERRGIFRDVITRQRFDDTHDRIYDMRVERVEADRGASADYELMEGDSAGTTRIRIGNPDVYITGLHTYRITYTLQDALNGFDDHDELYWNVIGAQWAVPILATTVRVQLPAEVQPRVVCFAGPAGSSLGCDRMEPRLGGAVFTHGLLDAYEGVTVVVGFPKAVVPEPAPRLEERWSLVRAFTLDPLRVGVTLLLLVGSVAAVVRLVWRGGRDVRWRGSPAEVVFGGQRGEQPVPLLEGGAYAIEYAPPEGIRPGQIGTLLDEVAHPRDVSATIVDLAARGHLFIEEIPPTGWFGRRDWRLIRKPSPEERQPLRAYERRLLDCLFRDGDQVDLSSLREQFAARLATVQDSLYDDAVAQGWFAERPDRRRNAYLGMAIFALVLSVALVVAAAAFTTFALVPVPLAFASLLLLALHSRMPRRTAKGTAVFRRTLGFRQFVETAETRRAEFAERAGLFYEYLPYAVVFGSVDRWAKAFEGLAVEPPSWYASMNAFTAMQFADAMDGFADTTSSALVSTPGGSGSSGFSGGSSGGGGGGGGGGSW